MYSKYKLSWSRCKYPKIYIYISVTICQDNLNYLVCLVRPKYLGRRLAISTHWQISVIDLIAEWESFHFQVLLSDPSDFDGGINCFDGQDGERQVRRKGGNLCWTKWVTLRERERDLFVSSMDWFKAMKETQVSAAKYRGIILGPKYWQGFYWENDESHLTDSFSSYPWHDHWPIDEVK